LTADEWIGSSGGDDGDGGFVMISGQVDDLLAIQNVNALCLPENYRLNVGNLNDAAAASCYLPNSLNGLCGS
jgi:hypothetical protein